MKTDIEGQADRHRGILRQRLEDDFMDGYSREEELYVLLLFWCFYCFVSSICLYFYCFVFLLLCVCIILCLYCFVVSFFCVLIVLRYFICVCIPFVLF